jgi:hypothetical protein
VSNSLYAIAVLVFDSPSSGIPLVSRNCLSTADQHISVSNGNEIGEESNEKKKKEILISIQKSLINALFFSGIPKRIASDYQFGQLGLYLELFRFLPKKLQQELLVNPRNPLDMRTMPIIVDPRSPSPPSWTVALATQLNRDFHLKGKWSEKCEIKQTVRGLKTGVFPFDLAIVEKQHNNTHSNINSSSNNSIYHQSPSNQNVKLIVDVTPPFYLLNDWKEPSSYKNQRSTEWNKENDAVDVASTQPEKDQESDQIPRRIYRLKETLYRLNFPTVPLIQVSSHDIERNITEVSERILSYFESLLNEQ